MPSFHDLTNIPINDDHDVTINSTNSTSNATSSINNSIHDTGNQFFDLTGHSIIDNSSSSLNHTDSHQTHHTESHHNNHEKTEPKCEPITLHMCKDIGYNHTKMPNQLNHDTQDEAGLEVNQFYPLVEINCSDDLRLFLCLIYVPVCMDDFSEFVPPCRSTCERAREGCEKIMMNYKFFWPKSMNCDKFPVHSSESICIDKKLQTNLPGSGHRETNPDMDNSIFNLGNIPIVEDNKHKDNDKIGSTVFDIFSEHANEENEQIDQEQTSSSKKKKNNKRIKVNSKSKSSDDFVGEQDHNAILISPNCKCECRRPFLPIHHLNDKRYFNQIVTGNQLNCAVPCHSPYFSRIEQKVTTFWITLFSIVCTFCTLITLLTFIANTKRFQYPERCIIFLSFSYLMVSIGFLVRLHVGHENVACDVLDNSNTEQLNLNRRISQDDIGSHHSINKETASDLLTLIRYENTGQIPGNCLIIFWLLYYFSMCASVWWVLLTLTWFLQAALKWSNEAIDSYSQYFHLIAWFTPAIKAIIVILIGAIDGDPLTGICYVGNLNDTNLLIFVIIPLCAYLAIGVLFLLSGFYSLWSIRNVLRQQTRSKTDKLEKLMVRIVIFSILYIIPGVIVILCNIYEYQHRQKWALNHNCQCKSKSSFHGLISETNSGIKITHFSNETPLHIVFLIKYIMCLVVGITSSFWIWSSKTLDSHIRFYGHLCCFYCCGACKPDEKVNSRETLRQSNNSMAAHLMSNIRQDSYQQQQQSSQLMTNSSQYTSNSNRAYKLLNQQQQMQQQFGPHLGSGMKSLSSSNNGSSSSHCKLQLPLSHV